MMFRPRLLLLTLGCFSMLAANANAQPSKSYAGPTINRNLDDYFVKEVWPKVGAVACLQCHKKGGDAEESKLILLDPSKAQGHAQEEALRHNRDAFAKLATVKHKDEFRMLVKVKGGLSHGGEDVLKPESKGYQILAEFVRRVNAPPSNVKAPVIDDKNLPPFFDGVTMLEPNRLLRRVTLSLAGRLPTDAERTAIAGKGMKALPT